jgi:Cu/Ag efflux pump CusA
VCVGARPVSRPTPCRPTAVNGSAIRLPAQKIINDCKIPASVPTVVHFLVCETDGCFKPILSSLAGLQEAIMHGAVRRIRPKVMTVACMFLGLVPIMWSTGAGADVMKRIAAPMIDGIFTSFILELVVYPAIYEVWKWHFEVK